MSYLNSFNSYSFHKNTFINYLDRLFDKKKSCCCFRFVDASDEYIEKGGDFVEICKICRQEGKCHFPGTSFQAGPTGFHDRGITISCK